MNTSNLKPLVQIQRNAENPDKDHLSVTMLLPIDVLQSLIDQAKASEDKRAAVIAEFSGAETDLTVEVYQPGEAKNLRYAENLKRDGKDGWATLVVATL